MAQSKNEQNVNLTQPAIDAAQEPKQQQETEKKKKPARGKPFKKGKSGNPKGAPTLPVEYKAIRKLSHHEIAEVGSIILTGSMTDMMKIANDPNATPLKVLLASVTVRAINKGDAHAMQEILNRIAGKVKERVEISGDPDNPIKMAVLKMTPEDMKQSAIRRYKMIEAADESE